MTHATSESAAAVAAELRAEIAAARRELEALAGGDARLLSVPQIAVLCDVSERTVWRWLRSGDLASVRVRDRRLVRSTALADFVIAVLT